MSYSKRLIEDHTPPRVVLILAFRRGGGFIQLRTVLISPKRRPKRYVGYAIRWGKQSNLSPYFLRGFNVAGHCISSHGYAQSCGIVRMMTQCGDCAG